MGVQVAFAIYKIYIQSNLGRMAVNVNAEMICDLMCTELREELSLGQFIQHVSEVLGSR